MDKRRSVRAIPRLVLAAFALVAAASSGASAQMTPPPDFLVTSPSSHDFDETVALLKQAIGAENLMVIDEINPQQMMRLVGMRTGGMRQLLFFHPRYMKAIIGANPNGGIEAPLKVLVMERPDGKTVVRYHDLKHLFAPYAGLEEIASEMQGAMERIVASVR
jgi:uncharacterized protein (DUF302 family)